MQTKIIFLSSFSLCLTACTAFPSQPGRTQEPLRPPTSTQAVQEPMVQTSEDGSVSKNQVVGSKILVPTLAPGAHCPITPIQEDFGGGFSPVQGEYPVWISSSGQMQWSAMGPNVLPPASGPLRFVEGHLIKVSVFVDQRVEGDVRITGRQLDGNSLVYFPQDGQLARVDESTARLAGIPPDFIIIDTAHTSRFFPAPPGKSHYGIAPIYLNPGCYQLTATIAEYSVNIVFEILDK
jgi:hypothetical protein